VIALSIGATSVAHGVHYAVLGVGLLGLLALLGPQLVGGRRSPATYDEHDHRVQALTEQLTGIRAPAPRLPVVGLRTSFLPVAIVSSAAAAGVHAAVGPAHFREQLLFGLFFAGSALAQIIWSVVMVVRPTRILLLGAIVGNSAVLMLWLVTRTVGLPVLLPSPEAVGPWDIWCGIWELVVVVCCQRVLRERAQPDELQLPPWDAWVPTARVWALGSALMLGALTLNGAGS
jgi:hypothetical protein